jgi:CSLREA domain-containing protein
MAELLIRGESAVKLEEVLMRRVIASTLHVLFSTLLLVGCGEQNNPGGGSGGSPNSPNFTISLGAPSLTVGQGSTGTVALTLTPQNGFTGSVSLSLQNSSGGAVTGISLSPPSLNVSGNSPVNQNLTISVGSGVAAQTYSLKLVATAGSIRREQSLNLTVTAGPSFTISLNPTSLTLIQGESKTTRLTLTPSGGFSGTVSLSLVNPPAGVSISPTSITASADITVATNASTPVGQHTLTLQASAGSIQRTANLTITVNQAQSFAVNTTADTIDADPGDGTCADSSGNCSLRAAVMEANALGSPTIINIPAGTYTLTRTSSIDEQGGDLDLKSDITLRGADQATTILDGNNATGLVEVFSDKRVSMENLTIQKAPGRVGFSTVAALRNEGTLSLSGVTIRDNGSSGDGDGFSNAGNATLTNVTLSNNSGTGFSNYGTATLTNVTLSNNGGRGFYNWRTATLTNVTLSNNSGTGFYNDYFATATLTNVTLSNNSGRGFHNSGTATLTNVTLSGNRTTDSSGGGGIYNGGTLDLNFTTITNNTAPGGGGLRIGSGTVRLRGVILSGNTATGGTGPECEGSLTSQGYNLIKSNADCSFTRDSTDILNQDANLAALANNGGSVQTHLPNTGSPVLDKVPAANCTTIGGTALSTDARGVSRPQNGSCDIGAVERQP